MAQVRGQDSLPGFTHRSPITGAFGAAMPGAGGELPLHLLPVVTNAYVREASGYASEIRADSVVVARVTMMTNVLSVLRAGRKIVPFLDGMPLVDVEGTIPDPAVSEIVFYLQRTAANRSAFDRLLMSGGYGTRPVIFSIGVPGEAPWPTEVRHLGFRRLSLNAILWVGGALFVYLVVSGIVAIKSNFLRDPIQANSTPPAGQPANLPPPFSLAKVQFFLWFSAVFSAFVLIYAATGDFNSIPGSMFVLLGISGATPGVAFLQDRFKDPTAGLPAGATPIQPVTNGAVPSGWKNGGFLWDLISNADGLSWNRVQMLLATIVLFTIFSISVLCNLTIPAFSSELVALMGISSGTFLLGLSSELHSSRQ